MFIYSIWTVLADGWSVGSRRSQRIIPALGTLWSSTSRAQSRLCPMQNSAVTYFHFLFGKNYNTHMLGFCLTPLFSVVDGKVGSPPWWENLWDCIKGCMHLKMLSQQHRSTEAWKKITSDLLSWSLNCNSSGMMSVMWVVSYHHPKLDWHRVLVVIVN